MIVACSCMLCSGPVYHNMFSYIALHAVLLQHTQCNINANIIANIGVTIGMLPYYNMSDQVVLYHAVLHDTMLHYIIGCCLTTQ